MPAFPKNKKKKANAKKKQTEFPILAKESILFLLFF